MNFEFYNKYRSEALDLQSDIIQELRKHSNITELNEASFVTLYLIYQAHKYNCLDLSIEATFTKLYDILEERLPRRNNMAVFSKYYNFISKVKVRTFKYLDEETWKVMKKLSKNYNINAIRTAVLLFDHLQPLTTPRDLLKLTSRILDIEPKEEVLNICAGEGNYLVIESTLNENACFTAVEPNEEICLIIAMKVTVLDLPIVLYDYSPFQLLENKKDKHFDKILNTCPTNQKYDYLFERYYLTKNEYFLSLMPPLTQEEVKLVDSEWVFSLLAASMLTKRGKAVSLVPNYLLKDHGNRPLRKSLLDQGLISTIIDLPKHIYPNYDEDLSMVIFTHDNKDSIKYVDATKICHKLLDGRMGLEPNDIEKIITMIEDSSQYTIISKEHIINNHYDLI